MSRITINDVTYQVELPTDDLGTRDFGLNAVAFIPAGPHTLRLYFVTASKVGVLM
jgi:hypothetical protein